jgi:thioredoxin-like negative regulator of GroEL
MIRVEYVVNEWVNEAKQTAIKAQITQAESLFHKALAYSPNSKLANYQLGRFYLDNGDDDQGLDWLRQHGMLLDVPRLA